MTFNCSGERKQGRCEGRQHDEEGAAASKASELRWRRRWGWRGLWISGVHERWGRESTLGFTQGTCNANVVDYIDLPPKEDSYSNLAESFTSSSSQWRVTKWTHVFVRLIPRLWLSLPSLRYPLLYYPVNLICVFNTVLSQRAMGHSYWLRRLRCFAGFCESGPRSSGVCANWIGRPPGDWHAFLLRLHSAKLRSGTVDAQFHELAPMCFHLKKERIASMSWVSFF